MSSNPGIKYLIVALASMRCTDSEAHQRDKLIMRLQATDTIKRVAAIDDTARFLMHKYH